MNIKFLSGINVFFNRFRRNEDGATALEYGLLVALIAIALMVGVGQVYTSMDKMFSKVADTATTVTQ